MTFMTPGRFIRSLRKTPVILQDILKDVTQEQAQQATDGPDGWSIVEIMCHLRDFEEIFFSRARSMVEQDNPVLPAYDEKLMAAERHYADQDLHNVLAAYLTTRQEFIEWLKERAESDWRRTAIHPEAGQVTLIEQAMQVPTHDIDHIEQMVRTLAAYFGK
ncbi:MAG: DinB family protein [Anaerolineae bacterium]|nr:MAG: DinB family protein [Anaerolineae bacterium]